MKAIFWMFIICWSVSAVSQDALTTLRVAQDKIYTPKAKALNDLVVDVVNPGITKQLNEQMIFGNLKEVIFRIYWTASPERVAVDILGMPEGFREIKEELKAVVVRNLEIIIPIPLEMKYQGYQFKMSSKQIKTVIATDQSNMQPIPEFEIMMDSEGRVQEVVAKKPIGIVSTRFTWNKSTWSEPRSHLLETKTRSEEGPQRTEIQSVTSWQTISGVGLPSLVKTKTSQVLSQPGQPNKPIERSYEEVIYFKNYKVNVGEAMKWFLGHSSPST